MDKPITLNLIVQIFWSINRPHMIARRQGNEYFAWFSVILVHTDIYTEYTELPT